MFVLIVQMKNNIEIQSAKPHLVEIKDLAIYLDAATRIPNPIFQFLARAIVVFKPLFV